MLVICETSSPSDLHFLGNIFDERQGSDIVLLTLFNQTVLLIRFGDLFLCVRVNKDLTVLDLGEITLGESCSVGL